MTITGAFMQNMTSNTSSRKHAKSEAGEKQSKFGDLLADTGKKATDRDRHTNTNPIKPELDRISDPVNERPVKKRENEKLEQPNKHQNHEEAEETVAHDPNVQPTDKPVEEASEVPVIAVKTDSSVNIAELPQTEESEEQTEINDKLMTELSELLNLPVDVLASMLQSLDMTALELVEPEKLRAFMTRLYDVESTSELLTKPNVTETMKDIQNVLDEVILQENGKEETTAFESFISSVENVYNDEPEYKPVVMYRQIIGSPIKPVAVDGETNSEQTPHEPGEIMPAEAHAVDLETTNGKNESRQSFSSSDNGGLMDQDLGNEIKPIVRPNPEPDFNPAINFDREARVFKTLMSNEMTRHVSARDIIEQIVSKISVEVGTGISEVKMLLKPENLGEVSMKIATQNGIVTAQFVAENQRVKETIEAGLNNLKDSLLRQGVNVSQISVSVDSGAAGSSSERFFNDRSSGLSGIRRTDTPGVEDGIQDIEKERILETSSVEYKA